MKDGGSKKNKWSGEDYGLYQIYGRHILAGKNALLYVGQAVQQTFSARFKQHEKDWMRYERGCKIHLGKVKADPKKDRGSRQWKKDVDIAEAILVYKYTPNYNSSLKQDEPDLKKYSYSCVRLIHKGKKKRLKPKDHAPEDYGYKKKDDRP
ncbi:MAG: hypothetical protein A2787_00495 [Omnitrophica WOR_2 bacterium RIFCSPHIGHO2_01_FULL_48_9]|nr:MAG: hypothetical protein A3D10_00095 [Omnitrophica WOR_2 bacterium RIFCSPHIGHO2_02_FULL_48_11]OGX33612.1 MAG: hypothetical protein A2787_00495 [Omnitrophica WOR_2 bacterium RIFCSPHIGHO2_01_FULL_48_9]